MGSVIKIQRGAYAPKENSRLRSKGQRLGWKSLHEEKRVPLREIVGKGEIVKEESITYARVAKLVL